MRPLTPLPLAPSEMEHAGSRVVRNARRSYNPIRGRTFWLRARTLPRNDRFDGIKNVCAALGEDRDFSRWRKPAALHNSVPCLLAGAWIT
jgi:hypothetical protein